ncbi:MAG: hypothetical protein ACYSSO_11365 [Planctomycetota bacterium]|jgi:hypothetical protein
MGVANVRKYCLFSFTLVELLVALMVMSVVLAAVAVLAFALGSAHNSSGDIARNQAELRTATLRISDLIKHCKLVCGTPGNDLALWRADDNSDGRINEEELVYIEAGSDRKYIRLLDFPTKPSWVNLDINPGDVQDGSAKAWLKFFCQRRYVTLIPQCSNVQFFLDTNAPQTQFVSISFHLEENSFPCHYQINASLQAWAGNLLDGNGDIVGDDD